MILNRQRRLRVRLSSLERFLERVRQIMNVPPDLLTVCLVTETEIARWNRTYLRKNGPTDVLSFPASDANGSGKRRRAKARRQGTREKPGKENAARLSHRRNGFSSTPSASLASSASYLGDIVIAPAVARHNARRFGRTFEDEMRVLILHGVLHLMGYDHETDHGEMDRLEARLRRRLGLA